MNKAVLSVKTIWFATELHFHLKPSKTLKAVNNLVLFTYINHVVETCFLIIFQLLVDSFQMSKKLCQFSHTVIIFCQSWKISENEKLTKVFKQFSTINQSVSVKKSRWPSILIIQPNQIMKNWMSGSNI